MFYFGPCIYYHYENPRPCICPTPSPNPANPLETQSPKYVCSSTRPKLSIMNVLIVRKPGNFSATRIQPQPLSTKGRIHRTVLETVPIILLLVVCPHSIKGRDATVPQAHTSIHSTDRQESHPCIPQGCSVSKGCCSRWLGSTAECHLCLNATLVLYVAGDYAAINGSRSAQDRARRGENPSCHRHY